MGKSDKKGFKKDLGKLGEKIAEEYLEHNKGYRIIEKNFTCFLGEIDLVALHGDSVIFVEVRSSTYSETNLVQYSIDFRKQKKLRQLANHYLQEKKIERPCRFDVVIVFFNRDRLTCNKVEVLANAF